MNFSFYGFSESVGKEPVELVVKTMEAEMPFQDNFTDCGIYVIAAMNRLTRRDKKFNFLKDADMLLMRKKIAYGILCKSMNL